MRVAEENAALESETFFAGQFHAVVVLEEPEAHLHTQLQHGLVTYLKEVVQQRPEVQVIITTHSDQIVAACEPEDLVVCVRTSEGPASRTIKNFGLTQTHRALVRRHLDVSRSASIFSDRVVLVEGITDAIVLRALARIWAGDDRLKRRVAESLTITVVGSRVGPWMYRLLANPAHPICSRIAVLSDLDGKPRPKWVAPATTMSDGRFRAFFSDPTLEPSLVDGNEAMFRELFARTNPTLRPWLIGGGPTSASVAEYFAARGRGRKGRFADDVAAYCNEHPAEVTVPTHLQQLLDFVWEGFLSPGATDGDTDDQ